MKLLGWMHRKLRQNSNDVFKEFNNGGGGTCNCITGLASPDPVTFLATANEYFAGDGFTTNNPSPHAADIFTFGGSGLLTIGTLGIAAVAVPSDADDDDYDVDDADAESDSDDNDDAVDEEDDADADADGAITPTFTYPPAEAEAAAVVEKAAAAVEAIAEKDDDTTTEDDLMVVSAELEKVLGGRSSGAAGDMVASARVSFAMGVADCPLQGFLFGSPVSDAESRLLDQPPRDSGGGGRRTSLGELFMRTRFADEKVALVAVEEGEDGGDGAAGGDNGKAGKECGGGGGGYKAMKKRRVKNGKVAAGGEGAPANAAVTKSKFQKILQIFHRKVYPESTALARSLTKKSRKRGSRGADEPEPPASPTLRCRKEHRAPGFGCCANRASFGGAASPIDDDELNGSKSGHWIKTDAEYLVLEL